MLAVFPLPSVLAAVYSLTSHLNKGVSNSGSFPAGPILMLLFVVAGRLTSLVAVALVVYLLVNSGEGLGSIGLGDRKLRTDLAWVLPVWFFVQVLPSYIGAAILRDFGLPTYRVISPPVAWPLLAGLVAS